MSALRTPLCTSTSEIIPSTFTVTANVSLVKSLYFQGVIWLITLTSMYYLPRPFKAVQRAPIPKVIRCNRTPYWDFQAWPRAIAQLPVEPLEKEENDTALSCHDTTAASTETVTGQHSCLWLVCLRLECEFCWTKGKLYCIKKEKMPFSQQVLSRTPPLLSWPGRAGAVGYGHTLSGRQRNPELCPPHLGPAPRHPSCRRRCAGRLGTRCGRSRPQQSGCWPWPPACRRAWPDIPLRFC